LLKTFLEFGECPACALHVNESKIAWTTEQPGSISRRMGRRKRSPEQDKLAEREQYRIFSLRLAAGWFAKAGNMFGFADIRLHASFLLLMHAAWVVSPPLYLSFITKLGRQLKRKRRKFFRLFVRFNEKSG
jgi:hypothetical protein